MAKEPVSAETESRQFDILSELGSIKGLISSILKRSKENTESVYRSSDEIISVLHELPVQTTMASSIDVTYSGRSDENIDEVIKKLGYMKLANKWTDDQVVGHLLCSLRNDALSFFESQDIDTFKEGEGANRKFSLNVFATKIKAAFPTDVSSADLMLDVLNCKQSKGQTVDDFLNVILPKINLLKDVNDDLKNSILINNFLPVISDYLKLQGDKVKTQADIIMWSRKIQKMSFTKKAQSNVVLSVDETEVLSSTMSQSGAANAATINKGQTKSSGVKCFKCRGPHFARDCQKTKYRQGNQYAQNKFTHQGQYTQSQYANNQYTPSQYVPRFSGPRFVTPTAPVYRPAVPYRRSSAPFFAPRAPVFIPRPFCEICKRSGHATELCWYGRPQRSHSFQATHRQQHLN